MQNRIKLIRAKRTALLEESETEREANGKDDEIAQQLQVDCDELAQKEREVYIAGCRVKTLRTENARLEWAIEQQEEHMQLVCNDWEKLLRNKSKVRHRIATLNVLITDYQNQEQDRLTETIGMYIGHVERLHLLSLASELRGEVIAQNTRAIFEHIEKLGPVVNWHSGKVGNQEEEKSRAVRIKHTSKSSTNQRPLPHNDNYNMNKE
ncbi:hypothetical protein PHET_02209 [Paragonimus heterotremus]|uniref:Uncharacterized protein n=1 Tax=Paragonimus heterotremus TaxID=100268 RepID=A0A8J4TLF0_9TREM|nr:hypothetical protein PHET_02209 [Paragonimus heterotremus]